MSPILSTLISNPTLCISFKCVGMSVFLYYAEYGIQYTDCLENDWIIFVKKSYHTTVCNTGSMDKGVHYFYVG